jgi:hypothetical protein
MKVGKPLDLGAVKVWPLIAPAHTFGTRTSFNVTDLQFEEMPDPDPRMLQVTNPTTDNIAVMWGTIIAGLRQTRMCAGSVIVPRGMTIALDTYCVEQNRFDNPVEPSVVGRAPISVMASGSIFDESRGRWIRGSSLGQRKTWDSIARQESRGGQRATSSLEQIMREDLSTFAELRNFEESVSTVIDPVAEFHGYAIAVGDQPLVLEIFGNPSEAPKQLSDTLRGLAFDIEQESRCRVTDSEIHRFINGAILSEMKNREVSDWELLLEGGDSGSEVRQLQDTQGNLVQMTMVNRNHRILIGA